jgi:hypothetical protein
MRVILAAALAPPAGLLLLGVVFDNTPIELRYLSFGLPFVAILAASARRSQGRVRTTAADAPGAAQAFHLFQGRVWPGHPGLAMRLATTSWLAGTAVLLPLLLALQTAGIAGLLLSPRTMQPARAAAAEAAQFAGDGLVLLPRGNDGVGIVGAFGIEAPPALPLLLVRPGDPIAGRVSSWHRIVLAALGQDRDSRATLPVVRSALAAANWRLVANGANVEVFEQE